MAKTKQEAGEQTALLDKPRVLFSEPGGGAQGERVRALAAELRALADKIEGIAEDDET